MNTEIPETIDAPVESKVEDAISPDYIVPNILETKLSEEQMKIMIQNIQTLVATVPMTNIFNPSLPVTNQVLEENLQHFQKLFLVMTGHIRDSVDSQGYVPDNNLVAAPAVLNNSKNRGRIRRYRQEKRRFTGPDTTVSNARRRAALAKPRDAKGQFIKTT
ncbi:hypothetical protein PCE1_001045 [Barthelona sp. PCE]